MIGILFDAYSDIEEGSMPIPYYLRDIASGESRKNDFTVFTVKCTCGSTWFDVYTSTLSREEKKACQPYFDALQDLFTNKYGTTCTVEEDGKIIQWKLLSPDVNGPKEKVELPAVPEYAFLQVIKVKCNACGEEHIIFDSRFHGYSGVFREKNDMVEKYIPHFKQRKHRDNLPVEIRIQVEHDPSFDAFMENTGIECSFEDYTNAFTWITVHEIDKAGKKRIIFDCETD